MAVNQVDLEPETIQVNTQDTAPKILPAAAVVLFSLSGFMAVGGALGAWLGLLAGTSIAQVLFFAAAPGIAAAAFGTGPGRLGLRLPSWRAALPAAVFVPVSLFFFFQYQAFQEEYLFSSRDDLRRMYVEAFGVGTNSPWLIVLGVAVIPAMAEEFLFRGFLMGALKARAGAALAVLISSSVFAVIHVEPSVMLPIFVFGLLLGSVTAVTGSLVPSVLMHFTNNLLVVVFLLDEAAEAFVQESVPAGVPWLAVSLAASILILWAGLRVKKT